MTRGEIYFVDLNLVVGREQHGVRPVLVVSTDDINTLPLVVTVVPDTKASRNRPPFPSNVIRALDPSRFPDQPSGRLSVARMQEVEVALRYVLGM